MSQSVPSGKLSQASWRTLSFGAGATGRSVQHYLFKRTRYQVLQLLGDLGSLALAWRLAIEVRLLLNAFSQRQFSRSQLLEVAPPLALICLLWIGVAWYLGLYRGSPRSASANLMIQAESAMVVAALNVVVAFFSQPLGAEISRSLTLVLAPASLVALLAGRYFVLAAAVLSETHWPTPERIVLVGGGGQLQEIAERLKTWGPLSVDLLGIVRPEGPREATLDSKALTTLGSLRDLGTLINRYHIDRLIMVDEALSESQWQWCVRISRRMGVTASRSLTPIESDSQAYLTTYAGFLMLEIRPRPYSRTEHRIKRLFDVVTSSLLLIGFGPLMLAIAAAIKLTSRGPVFYKAARVGKGGRYFTFLKYRSMYVAKSRAAASEASGNEHSNHVFKIRHDPRVTPIGRLLRRTSLDELPQLINVLRGDMSLVGPRPLPITDMDPDGQSQRFSDWSQVRSNVPPGITGLWQVSGRSDLPFEKWVELDIEYVKTWSLGLDLRILLVTPLVVLTGKGAY